MVKLTEVEDEHFQEKPTATKRNELFADDDDDEDFTDTDSEISSVASDDEDLPEETFVDRVYALRDIVPPTTRTKISTTVSTVTSYTKGSLWFGGKALWVISTSALLLGVPWALAYAEEQQFVEMEKEQAMMKGANEMLTPGATNPQGQQGAQPAL